MDHPQHEVENASKKEVIKISLFPKGLISMRSGGPSRNTTRANQNCLHSFFNYEQCLSVFSQWYLKEIYLIWFLDNALAKIIFLVDINFTRLVASLDISIKQCVDKLIRRFEPFSIKGISKRYDESGLIYLWCGYGVSAGRLQKHIIT